MSQKIDDALHVLATIGKGYRADERLSLRYSRVRAIHEIAKQRQVTHQTFGDAYLR